MPLNALSYALGRPTFGGGLFQVGQQAGQQGAFAGYNQSVMAEQERLKQEEQMQQKGLLSAYGLGNNPGNSNPMQALAAIQEGTGVDAAKALTMMQAGQQQASSTAANAEKRRVAEQEAGITRALTNMLGDDPANARLRQVVAQAGNIKQLPDSLQKILWSRAGLKEEDVLTAVSTQGKLAQDMGYVPGTAAFRDQVAKLAQPKAGEAKFNADAAFAGLDLTNPADIDKAETIALNNNQPSLANSLRFRKNEQIASNQGVDIKDVMETASSIDPAFTGYQEHYSIAERVLQEVDNSNLAGATALIERLVTSTAPNDLKAVAELNRFRGSKSVGRRVADWVSQGFTGELTDATLDDFKAFAESLQDYSEAKILRVADTIDTLPGTQNQSFADTIRLINGGIRGDEDGFSIVNTGQ